ncbi:MAG: glycosyltransferase family 2 protein [Candidatus Calescibacterium sp.]
MPVYNEGKYVSQTIESALSQTFRNFQIIISDNNSQDNTYDICCSYAEKDSRIKVFRQKKNIGALKNFKFVLEKADTPFFIYLSGHDLWHPQLLEKLLEGFKNSSDKDLVLVFPSAVWLGGGKIEENYDTTGINDPIKRFKFIVKNLGTCTLFYGLWRTDVIKKLNFRSIIKNDVLILAQASLIGKFKKVNEELFFRRKNHDYLDYLDKYQLMLKRQIQNILGDDKILEKIRKFSVKNPNSYLFNLWIFLEQLLFIFEHVKMIFESQKFGVNLTTSQKIYLAGWAAFTLSYYKTYVLNPKFARIVYEAYKKIKDVIVSQN